MLGKIKRLRRRARAAARLVLLLEEAESTRVKLKVRADNERLRAQVHDERLKSKQDILIIECDDLLTKIRKEIDKIA